MHLPPTVTDFSYSVIGEEAKDVAADLNNINEATHEKKKKIRVEKAKPSKMHVLDLEPIYMPSANDEQELNTSSELNTVETIDNNLK